MLSSIIILTDSQSHISKISDTFLYMLCKPHQSWSDG